MTTIFISQAEHDDFMDEEDTQPMLFQTVQDQLNASQSVASFTAAAQARMPKEKPMHWTERLDIELGGMENLFDAPDRA